MQNQNEFEERLQTQQARIIAEIALEDAMSMASLTLKLDELAVIKGTDYQEAFLEGWNYCMGEEAARNCSIIIKYNELKQKEQVRSYWSYLDFPN